MSSANGLFNEDEVLGEMGAVNEVVSERKENGNRVVELNSTIAEDDHLEMIGEDRLLDEADISLSKEETPEDANEADPGVKPAILEDPEAVEAIRGVSEEKVEKVVEETSGINDVDPGVISNDDDDVDEEKSGSEDEEKIVVVGDNVESIDGDIDVVDDEIDVVGGVVDDIVPKRMPMKQKEETDDDEDDIMIVWDNHEEQKKMKEREPKSSTIEAPAFRAKIPQAQMAPAPGFARRQQEAIRKEVEGQLTGQLQIHLAPLYATIADLQTKCNVYEYILASMPENPLTHQWLRPMLLRNPLTAALTPKALQELLEAGKQKMAADSLRSQGSPSENASAPDSLDPQPARSILEQIIAFEQQMVDVVSAQTASSESVPGPSTSAPHAFSTLSQFGLLPPVLPTTSALSSSGSSSSQPSTSTSGQCFHEEEFPRVETPEESVEEPEAKKCRTD